VIENPDVSADPEIKSCLSLKLLALPRESSLLGINYGNMDV
jgi:hypothetical protein